MTNRNGYPRHSRTWVHIRISWERDAEFLTLFYSTYWNWRSRVRKLLLILIRVCISYHTFIVYHIMDILSYINDIYQQTTHMANKPVTVKVWPFTSASNVYPCMFNMYMYIYIFISITHGKNYFKSNVIMFSAKKQTNHTSGNVAEQIVVHDRVRIWLLIVQYNI